MTQLKQDRIEKIVELNVPISQVWQALANHEEFGTWFRVSLDGPFVVGSVTTGKITYPGAEHMIWESTTEQMVHEEVFAFSWPPSTLDPDTEYDAGAKMLVEFRLEPTDSGTRLTITESGFLQFPETKRLNALRGNIEGWNIQALHITAHLAG